MADRRRTWLGSSGQRWRIDGSLLASLVGLALFAVGLSVRSRGGSLWTLSGVPLLVLGQVLPGTIRCRICGLSLRTSSIGRALKPGPYYGWITTLEACPVCGDDGRASAEGRAAWVAAGRPAEPAYWTAGKLAVVGLALAAAGGLIAFATTLR